MDQGDHQCYRLRGGRSMPSVIPGRLHKVIVNPVFAPALPLFLYPSLIMQMANPDNSIESRAKTFWDLFTAVVLSTSTSHTTVSNETRIWTESKKKFNCIYTSILTYNHIYTIIKFLPPIRLCNSCGVSELVAAVRKSKEIKKGKKLINNRRS